MRLFCNHVNSRPANWRNCVMRSPPTVLARSEYVERAAAATEGAMVTALSALTAPTLVSSSSSSDAPSSSSDDSSSSSGGGIDGGAKAGGAIDGGAMAAIISEGVSRKAPSGARCWGALPLSGG